MTFKFTSFSESGQDAFAYQQLSGRPGTFLDIGSGHPLVRSNSAGLEMCGWRGLCIDKNPEFASVWHLRRAPLMIVDAVALYCHEIGDFYKKREIDYLSLDVDKDTPLVLEGLLNSGFSFKCATIEHDAYVNTDSMFMIRGLMGLKYRYYLHTSEVQTSDGRIYEDWWTENSDATPFTQNFDRVQFTA